MRQMIYRMRIYRAVEDRLPTFHEFFEDCLLPVQLRHGARLVGRWGTHDKRVVAVWEYDDMRAYEKIERAVRGDPDSVTVLERRRSLGKLFTEREGVFMSSTV